MKFCGRHLKVIIIKKYYWITLRLSNDKRNLAFIFLDITVYEYLICFAIADMNFSFKNSLLMIELI